MTLTVDHIFEGKAKSPVFALEENGHLQYRLFNVLSLISNGVRGPHSLGHYSASVRDSAVKKPSRGVEWLYLGVQSRANKKEMTFSVGVGCQFNRWNRVGLQ